MKGGDIFIGPRLIGAFLYKHRKHFGEWSWCSKGHQLVDSRGLTSDTDIPT